MIGLIVAAVVVWATKPLCVMIVHEHLPRLSCEREERIARHQIKRAVYQRAAGRFMVGACVLAMIVGATTSPPH